MVMVKVIVTPCGEKSTKKCKTGMVRAFLTLKASPLNNRGYERSEHPRTAINTHPLHPERVPQQVQVEVDPWAGATPLGSMLSLSHPPGVLRTPGY